MKIVPFEKQNTVYAKDQPQYHPLPCYRVPDDSEGRIVFCWSLNFAERIKVLFVGKIWGQVLTFNQPLQPQSMDVRYPFNP